MWYTSDDRLLSLFLCFLLLFFWLWTVCCVDSWLFYARWGGCACFECNRIAYKYRRWCVVLVCQISTEKEQAAKVGLWHWGTQEVKLAKMCVLWKQESATGDWILVMDGGSTCSWNVVVCGLSLVISGTILYHVKLCNLPGRYEEVGNCSHIRRNDIGLVKSSGITVCVSFLVESIISI